MTSKSPLTDQVIEAMRQLDRSKKFVDDPYWTTERALAILDELERLRIENKQLRVLCGEIL